MTVDANGGLHAMYVVYGEGRTVMHRRLGWSLKRYDGREFVGVSSDDIEAGHIDPSEPTVVLVHGWNRDNHPSLNEPRRIWTELAEAIRAYSPDTTILAWDWLNAARSVQTHRPDGPPPTERVEGQGEGLADALEELFADHLPGPPIHLLGHSLGAAVVAHCADSSTGLRIQRVTLWDAPENWQACVVHGQVGIGPVVTRLAARSIPVDSYYAAYGEPYQDATQNVDLRTAALETHGAIDWRPMVGIPQHGYPMEWYVDTILNPAFSQLCKTGEPWIIIPIEDHYAGWPWSPATRGAYPVGQGHWYAKTFGGREGIGRLLFPKAAQPVVSVPAPTPIAQVGLAVDEWTASGDVSETHEGIQLAEGSSASIWRALDVPEDADGLDLEYFFATTGDGDSLALYCEDELLWSTRGTHFEGSDYVPTPFVNISFAQGQTVTIKVVLQSVGEDNAVVRLRDLRLLHQAPPAQQCLEVTVWGEGTVLPESGLYDLNSQVDLVASADDGWEFVRWHGVDTQDVNRASVTIDTNRMVLAEFLAVPSIVTDANSVTVPEGGTAAFQVKLSAQPASDVTVSVTRASGDSDIEVQSGSSLEFSSSSWDTYQQVTLSAGQDDDVANGQATIRCSCQQASPSKEVTATERDDDTDGSGPDQPAPGISGCGAAPALLVCLCVLGLAALRSKRSR